MWISIISSLKLENTVPGGEQFFKPGYSEAIAKVFFCQDFYQHWQGGGGQLGYMVLVLRKAACEQSQHLWPGW